MNGKTVTYLYPEGPERIEYKWEGDGEKLKGTVTLFTRPLELKK